MIRVSDKPESTEILVLGAGLTGLSTAYHLQSDCIVVDAAGAPGGAASTLTYKGFHLDRAVHILYFRDQWTSKFITENLGIPLQCQKRNSTVWFNKRFVSFPIQFHLASLPLYQRFKYGMSVACSKLYKNGNGQEETLGNWAQRNFGRALARDFFIPYNEKLHGVSCDKIQTQWMDGYVPSPSISKLVNGLLKTNRLEVGNNATFWYPVKGGIATIVNSLAEKIKDVRFNKRLISIDLQRKIATFQDGSQIAYHQLVSTIPLNTLTNSISPSRKSYIELSNKLQWNSVEFAHLMIPQSNIGKGIHWIYIPQRDVPFYRITLPHNINTANCPEGWSALTLEFGKHVQRKQTTEVICKKYLRAMGLLDESSLNSELIWDQLDHGYVIYNSDWTDSRHEIQRILRKYGVISIGRYGRWEYSNMESALIQGREASKHLEALPENETDVTQHFLDG